MRQRGGILGKIDWTLVLLYLVLVLMGWGNIYAAVYNDEASSIFDITQKYGKQMLWIITSLVMVIIVLAVDNSIFQTLAYPIFILSLLSLAAVLLFGTEIAGARSWFSFGGISIQPSEFAKFATSLAIARYLSTKGAGLKSWRQKLSAWPLSYCPRHSLFRSPTPVQLWCTPH
ncbi:MAG: rod shape-determining protein RodA [Owenweeksia sp.]|nr:rod shape-determining protein RodA [Owenweeksia sp.]